KALRLGGAELAVMVPLPGLGARCGTRGGAACDGGEQRRSRASTHRLVDRRWHKHLALAGGVRWCRADASALQMCARAATLGETRRARVASPYAQSHNRS